MESSLSLTNTGCDAENWEQYETTCFQNQNQVSSFVTCASLCQEKHAALPCIEDEAMNKFLFDLYGDNGYWTGLFQTQDIDANTTNWNNWQMEGCSSTYRNFAEKGLNHMLSGTDTCGGVVGSLWSHTFGINADEWVDGPCDTDSSFLNVQCICQYSEEKTDTVFTLAEKKWEEFGTTSFQEQKGYYDFVSCANKCQEKHAALPCINNATIDQFLFELYGGEPYWTGLYQTPGTVDAKANWNKWQMEGCNSKYQNFVEVDFFDGFFTQEACAIIVGKLGAELFGDLSGKGSAAEWAKEWAPKWDDNQCNAPFRCICQSQGNATDIFLDTDASLLLEQSGKTILPLYVLYSDAIESLLAIALIFFSIKILRRMHGTSNNKSLSHILQIILAALLLSVLSSCYSFIMVNFQQDTYTGPSTIYNFLYMIETSLVLITILMKVLDLLDSAALATGGVKETRKLWLQFLRAFNIFNLSVLLSLEVTWGISLYDKEDYADYWRFVFSKRAQMLSTIITWFRCALTLILSVSCLLVFLKIRKILKNGSMAQYNSNHLLERYKELRSMAIFFGIIIILLWLTFQRKDEFIGTKTSIFVTIGSFLKILLYFVVLKDAARMTKLHKYNSKKEEQQEETQNIEAISLFDTIAIQDSNRQEIGRAPLAQKPNILDFTPTVGQADIVPIRWSLSLTNAIQFIKLCMSTETWRVLAEIKGEYNITLHDINTHFVVPWTKGTGCSIALLFDQDPGKVELMFSHSWSASIKQTYNALRTITLMHKVPGDTQIFFCTLCQYQAQDGAPRGLSIQQQLNMDPFSEVIHCKPKYGMFIIHTLISEVYDRLWCVLEAHEGMQADLELTGLFDPTNWELLDFKNMMKVNTELAECAPTDREKLIKKINEQGGFIRLDKAILRFRKVAYQDLRSTLKFEAMLGIDILNLEEVGHVVPSVQDIAVGDDVEEVDYVSPSVQDIAVGADVDHDEFSV